jgi:integrase
VRTATVLSNLVPNNSDGLLNEARREVAALKPVSQKTMHAYQAMICRVIEGRAAPRSRRTSQLYLAAWVWAARIALASLLERNTAGDPSSIQTISEQLRVLAEIRAADLPKAGKRCSKRQGLGKLPAGWQVRMIEVASDDDLKALLELLSISGVRPAEIEAGVSAEVCGGDLLLTIDGAKFTGTTGQKWRSVRISSNRPEVSNIVRLASEQPEFKIRLKVGSAWLRRNVRTLGKRCFPELAYSIAPYSFRHAVASDCKRAGVGSVEIARLLGHRATRTQSAYGAAGLGRSGAVTEIDVAASNEVRDTSSDPRRLHIVCRDKPGTAS